MGKKGISLITLIITIVVIIILSAVTILSITSNNPVNSSKVASLSQTMDSIQTAIKSYLGKIRADTLGKYTTSQILLGSKAATLEYKITTNAQTLYIEEEGIKKKVYELDIETLKEKVELEITEQYADFNWCVDDKGNVYIVYETIAEIPDYIKENNEISEMVSSYVKIETTGIDDSQGNLTNAELSFEDEIVEVVYEEDAEYDNLNTLTKAGDGIVTYSSSDETVARVNESGEVQIRGTGTITITAEVSDTENYTYTTKKASYTLIVNQKEIQVLQSPEDKSYIGTSQDHGINIPTGVEIISEGSTLSATEVGTYMIAVKLKDSNYIWSNGTNTNKIVTWKIVDNRANGTISFANDGITKEYGDSSFVNTLTNTGDGTVTYVSSNTSVATVNSSGEISIVGIGETIVTATVVDTLNYKYATKEISYTLTVNIKSISISSPEDKSYDGTSKNHGINIPTGAEIVTSGSTLSATEPGTYTVIVKLSDTSNYIWSDGTTENKNVTWKIVDDRANGTISFTNATMAKTYGDALFTNYLTNTGDGTVTYASSNTSVATIDSYGIVSIVGSGETIVTATVVDTLNYKYATKEISYPLTVSKKSISISSPEDKSYDGTSKSHGISIPTGAEIVNAGSTLSATEPGTYTVIVKLSNSNYIWNDGTTENKNVTWKIVDNREAASISFANATMTKTYGDALFTNYLTNTGDGTVTYTSSNTSVATIDSYGTVSIVGLGETTITATVTDSVNYKYATKQISYTLNVSITAADIGYTPSDNTWNVENVQQAITSLYNTLN